MTPLSEGILGSNLSSAINISNIETLRQKLAFQSNTSYLFMHENIYSVEKDIYITDVKTLASAGS